MNAGTSTTANCRTGRWIPTPCGWAAQTIKPVRPLQARCNGQRRAAGAHLCQSDGVMCCRVSVLCSFEKLLTKRMLLATVAFTRMPTCAGERGFVGEIGDVMIYRSGLHWWHGLTWFACLRVCMPYIMPLIDDTNCCLCITVLKRNNQAPRIELAADARWARGCACVHGCLSLRPNVQSCARQERSLPGRSTAAGEIPSRHGHLKHT